MQRIESNCATGVVRTVELTAAEVAAIPVLTLAQRQDAAWTRIKSERDRRIQKGAKVGLKWYHTDDRSTVQHLGNKDTARDQMAGGALASSALLEPTTLEPIVWKTMDGTFQPMTCQLAIDIVKACKAQEFAHYKAAVAHQTAMMASLTPETYNHLTGWPAIFGT